MFQLKEFLAHHEALVNIDSGSYVPGGTAKVADYLQKLYEELGLSVKRYEGTGGVGPRLEVRNHPEKKRVQALFLGHMDTVFPDGEAKRRPYRVENGVAHGPGAMDMKGGDVLLYFLVRRLVKELPDFSFCIAHNSDEELSSAQSYEWIQELAREADCAIVFEPGRPQGEFVSQRKGVSRYDVQFFGIASHSGAAPKDGASAIHTMADFIMKIRGAENEAQGTTVNVGLVQGGTAVNVLSAHAQCAVDVRFQSEEEYRRLSHVIREAQENPLDARVRVEITETGYRPAMMPFAKTQILMQRLEAAGEKTGLSVQWIHTGGASDGNFCSALGCPTIDGCGPCGAGAHTSDETLLVDTAEPRLETLFALLCDLHQHPFTADE
uniref:M20 family metallopeptidase n=1 Tax=Ndongobacter massiliensis TaxID=1871025 RepID=UPI000930E0A4|nr:M20 family metallopeptidase [Ndongobacter massiliensis]